MSDHPQPDPEIWPQCSTCGTAFVLRRGLSISKGWMWLWQRDCKHKTDEPAIEQREDAEQRRIESAFDPDPEAD